MRSDDFLPCPFCGTERPSVWKRDDGWVVKCVEGCCVTIEGYNSRKGAMKAWNRRPAGAVGPSVLMVQFEEMAGELAELQRQYAIGTVVQHETRLSDEEVVIGFELSPFPGSDDVRMMKPCIKTYFNRQIHWTYPECCKILRPAPQAVEKRVTGTPPLEAAVSSQEVV